MVDGLPIGSLSASGLLALVVLLIITDRLVWYKRLKPLTERIEKQDELIHELTEQNKMLLNSAVPTVNSVLTALHRAAAIEAEEDT